MTQNGSAGRAGQDEPEEIGGYIIERPLGRGGQATVFLARAADGSPVAVKVLSEQWLADAESRRRLDQEIVALRDVAPFAIARLLDARPDAHPPYLVTEYVPGPSLQEQVVRAGPLTGPGLQRLAISTITGLLAVHHTGLVHRDVKPANVILGPDGARLVDFGIAGYAGEAEDADAGVLGTPAYLPPERLVGGPSATASDVYAWAATMLFAATGKVPQPVVAGTDGLPAEFAAVLRQCLDPDPAARPSASQVLPLLVEAFDPKDLTVPFDPPPPAVPPGSGARDARPVATSPAAVLPVAASTTPVTSAPNRGGPGGALPVWGSPAPASPRSGRAASAATATPVHGQGATTGGSSFRSLIGAVLALAIPLGVITAFAAVTDSWSVDPAAPAQVGPETVGTGLLNRMPVPWVSADGRFVAVVDESGALVRQPLSGDVPDRLADQVAAGAQPQDLSPDGTLLAAIGGGRKGEGQVVTVTRVGGGEVARLPVDGPVRARFSGDGHHLLVASHGKPAPSLPASSAGASAGPVGHLLQAWDTRTWTVFRVAAGVREWSVGQEGHVVLADGIGLVTWDLGRGAVDMIPSAGLDGTGTDPRNEVVALAIAPDGGRVAVVTAPRPNVIEMWSVPSRRAVASLAPERAPRALAFVPGRDALAVGSSVGTVAMYRVKRGGALRETPVWAGSSARVATLREFRFSSDGRVLVASRQEDTGIEVYRVEIS